MRLIIQEEREEDLQQVLISKTEVGIDEVGRGAIFGPVFSGVVVLSNKNGLILKKLGVKDSKKLSSQKRELLLNHNWPGNVRELENTLQRALVLCNENIVDEKSIMIDKSLSKINENSSIESFAEQLAFAKVT